MLTAGLLLAACGGGSDSSTATASSAPDTTVADPTVPATDAATTTPSTAPPTTLPPTLDLNTLPGLLAVKATSCAPEPYHYDEVVDNAIICTLKPNGTDVKVVSQPGEIPWYGLAFTRGGTHLWYGELNTKRGFVIDLATGERRERQRYEPLGLATSPDGQLLLTSDLYSYVLSITNSDGSLFPDGSTSLPVSDDPLYDYNTDRVSWAPDSVRFAYLSTNGLDLECAEVWVGAIDGRPPVKITDFTANPDGAEGCPESVRWSPTDDRILLHMLGKPKHVAENLYAIDADGSDLTALTRGLPADDPSGAVYAGAGNSTAGDWSPDGRYIVFLVGDGTTYQLAVMNADGSQVTPIPAPLGISTSLWSIRWSSG